MPSPTRKKRSPKPCSPDQIRNPKTNRCVKKSGAIGRKILSSRRRKTSGGKRRLKPCSPDQVRNPETNRCVKKSGAIGRKILGVHKVGKRKTKKSSRKSSGSKYSRMKILPYDKKLFEQWEEDYKDVKMERPHPTLRFSPINETRFIPSIDKQIKVKIEQDIY
jgi:hypothetical protein